MQLAGVLHPYPITWFLYIIQAFNLLKVLFHYHVLKGYLGLGPLFNVMSLSHHIRKSVLHISAISQRDIGFIPSPDPDLACNFC